MQAARPGAPPPSIACSHHMARSREAELQMLGLGAFLLLCVNSRKMAGTALSTHSVFANYLCVQQTDFGGPRQPTCEVGGKQSASGASGWGSRRGRAAGTVCSLERAPCRGSWGTRRPRGPTGRGTCCFSWPRPPLCCPCPPLAHAVTAPDTVTAVASWATGSQPPELCPPPPVTPSASRSWPSLRTLPLRCLNAGSLPGASVQLPPAGRRAPNT